MVRVIEDLRGIRPQLQARQTTRKLRGSAKYCGGSGNLGFEKLTGIYGRSSGIDGFSTKIDACVILKFIWIYAVANN